MLEYKKVDSMTWLQNGNSTNKKQIWTLIPARFIGMVLPPMHQKWNNALQQSHPVGHFVVDVESLVGQINLPPFE
jgi:hypothetical protein